MLLFIQHLEKGASIVLPADNLSLTGLFYTRMITLTDEHAQRPLPLFTPEQALAFETFCSRIVAELLPSPVSLLAFLM